MNGKGWTEEEKDILKANYPRLNCKQMMDLLPGRTYKQIRGQVGWSKLSARKPKMNNCERLNEETHEAYYWLGLLMADGSFDNGRINLCLNQTDVDHMEKFRKFIESTNVITKSKTDNCLKTSAMDKKAVEKITQKFDLKPKKTYNPINLSIFDRINPEFFIAFICGFIDGDGCIQIREGKLSTTKGTVTLGIIGNECWKDNFIKFFTFLHAYFKEEMTSQLPKIRHQKGTQPADRLDTSIRSEVKTYSFANFVINRRSLIESIKKEVVRLKLPYLARKWDKIVTD